MILVVVLFTACNRNIKNLFDRNVTKLVVNEVDFDYLTSKAKVDFDWQVMHVDLEAERLPKEVFWIPALGLLGLIIVAQRRRRILEEA